MKIAWPLLAALSLLAAGCDAIGDGAQIRGFCETQTHLNCDCFVKEIEKKKKDDPDAYRTMIKYFDIKAHKGDDAADNMLNGQPMKDGLFVAGAAMTAGLTCATARAK